MCSRLLKPHRPDANDWETRLVRYIDVRFEKLLHWYQRKLEKSLRYTPVTAVLVFVVLGAIYFMYSTSKSELAPQEDQGFVIMQATSAPDSTLQGKLLYGQQARDIALSVTKPPPEHVFQITSPGQVIMGMPLVARDLRKYSANDIQQALSKRFSEITGQKIAVFQPPSLPGSFGLPIQFAITSTDSASRLNDVSQEFLAKVVKSGMFMFIDTDLKYDLPQSVIEIDRDKAAQLGLTMTQVGNALGSLLGGNYVNYFSMDTRSYKVIPQVERLSRLNVSELLNYPVANIGGVPILLSSIATIKPVTVPETLNHFQQLNSATLSGVMAPGVTLDDALSYLRKLAKDTLPSGYTVDNGGQGRQLVQESGGIMTTFAFAIIIVFLALAALFESFRDPLVILISVPLSIAGALIFISLGVHSASLNIYTQVGLVTLMGLISKHGILIVEVANAEQKTGKSKHQAIVAAAGTRLRPILMTTAAMVLGVLPLVFASGAGAASRYAIGIVISTGLAIGTVFTLFVVPGVYMLVGATHNSRESSEPSSVGPERLPNIN
jgi:multidrug efflux pump